MAICILMKHSATLCILLYLYLASLVIAVPGTVLDIQIQHHFDPDPDPACHFDADSDPTFHFDADSDPTFHFDADPSGSGSTTLLQFAPLSLNIFSYSLLENCFVRFLYPCSFVPFSYPEDV